MMSGRFALVRILALIGAIALATGCSPGDPAPASPARATYTTAAGTPIHTDTAVPSAAVPSTTPPPSATETAAPTETASPAPDTATIILNSPTALTAAPPASATSAATAAPTGPSARVSDSTVSFAAYPYEQFLKPQHDAAYNMTFSALDRGAYDRAASAQELGSRTFHAVVLENEFLRLTFLPDLGGRLFQITYKPTNQNLLYNNHVLKPTGYGPANQGGWLAAGGMEWSFPVNEHGYEWGTPWKYQVDLHSDGVSLTLSDTLATDRAQARVVVFLPNDAALIWIHPEIANPTTVPVRLQFWINAGLALGAAKNVSPGTEFVLPTDSVFVHSTADQFIPRGNVPRDGASGPAAPLVWSRIGGHDLASYSNWEDYLGVFAANITRPFVGAYNHDTDLGIARVFPPERAPGVKLFAFGPKFCCRSQIADDDSDYFELWGGLPRTFFPSDDVTLAPGETRMWDEYWVPFAKTGGLSAATKDAVLNLKRDNGNVQVSAYSPILRRGTLLLLQDGGEIKRWLLTLVPGASFSARVPAGPGPIQLRLLAEDGSVLAETE